MGSTQITRELALKIAKKLEATVKKSGGAHDSAVVRHNGVFVAHFGIRRDKRKNLGHDHIPAAIHVSPRFAKELGICTKQRSEWIQAMIDAGHITS